MRNWKSFELLDEALAIAAPWHRQIGRTGLPVRPLYFVPNTQSGLTDLSIRSSRRHAPESIQGTNASGDLLEVKFSTRSSDHVLTELLRGGRRELLIGESIDRENRTLRFTMEGSDPAKSLKMFLSADQDRLTAGIDQLDVVLRIGKDELTSRETFGSQKWPKVLMDYNELLQARPELQPTPIYSLHPDLTAPLAFMTWDFSGDPRADLNWEGAACAFGTGLSDFFTPLVTAIYGAANVLFL